MRVLADLQVSKAAGILGFSAIVCALAAFLLERVDPAHASAEFSFALGAALALLGSFCTLGALWSTAPSFDAFSTASKESDWLAELHRRRAWLCNVAVLLVGLAGCALFVGAFERWRLTAA
jgi:hypothetical protein